MVDNDETQNDIDNNNTSTENDGDTASPRKRKKRRKRQKGYIVPLETKVTCHQMKVFNREMQYETVIGKYWPTDSDNNTKLDEQYTPITGIMINMKDVFAILKPDTA